MKKQKLAPLFMLMLPTLFAINKSLANDVNENETQRLFIPTLAQCLRDVPKLKHEPYQPRQDQPIHITSTVLDGLFPTKAVYTGDVQVTQGDTEANSNQLTLVEKDSTKMAYLNGDVVYQDNLIRLKSNEATINLENNDVEVNNMQYHYVGRLGRGTAKKTTYLEERYVTLYDSTFTSCPTNDNAWSVYGTKMVYDNEEELIEIKNAVFKVGPVPVFYSPYFQFPTSDKRRTGLLKPEFHYDSVDGFEATVPFYWNIAPNYDLTFTPRYMQRRGTLFQNEFRYLNALGLGTLELDYLPHDKLYKGEQSKRWLLYLKNGKSFNQNWRLDLNAIRVSDNDYLRDIGSPLVSETETSLKQEAKLAYNNAKWSINLLYRHFQILSEGISNSLYFLTPQLNLNYYDSYKGVNYHQFLQVSRFTSRGDRAPEAWRYHAEPMISKRFALSSWFSVNAKTGVYLTHYDQDIPELNRNHALEKNVNRVIPTASIDSTILLERALENGYHQTIEPRVKYTYTAYRDQSHINNFDSTLLQMNYFEMFRDRTFSGIDRIASANKIAMGMTTRFYDEYKQERFNLSFGQMYYFDKAKTGDASSRLDQNSTTGRVSWATDMYYLLRQDLILRAGLQYDTRLEAVALASAVIEYQPEDRKIIQASYRYADRNYIDNIGLGSSILPYKQNISQIGLVATYPLTENVSALGTVYYDTERNRTEDSFAGLTYSNCCWGFNVLYGRKVSGWDSNTDQSKFQNKLSFSFEFKGLGNNSNAIPKMLDFGLIPYKTSF